MNRKRIVELLLFAAINAVSNSSLNAEIGHFGAARININPTTPIRLSGHAFRSTLPEATDIQLDLFAQAAAFDTGSDTSLLITVDSTNMPRQLVDAVKASIAVSHGIATERIVITSTHSHSAPHVNRPSNLFDPAVRPLTPVEQQHIDLYTEQLVDRLKQVASDALENRSPGHQVSWGQGTVEFGLNRRGTPNAPNDHDLPVMRVTDASGTVRAILTSYATHGTTLSPADNLISGDWPGYAHDAIEVHYPDAVALVMLGAAGDSNPTPRGTVAYAQDYGQRVATEIQRLITNNLLTPASGKITAVHGKVELPFATQLEPGDPSDARLATTPGSHQYGITSWTFGDDLAMAFFEGELTVDYALRLKSELDHTRLWVNAYSNDVPGYIPSERILDEGGYEADDSSYWYALPGRFAHGLEDKIITEAHRQLKPFFFPTDRLQLMIEWDSGALVIHNPTHEPITLDAYTITSRDARLDVSAGRWNSLQDQAIGGWEKADNANASRLTEFNPGGASTLQPGESLTLGMPYSFPVPSEFGVSPHGAGDLGFHYGHVSKGTINGLIQYAGAHNNLVLTIDPSTGNAAIQNQSPFFDVAIDGYTIESASGLLRPDEWASFQDQGIAGWNEADNGSAYRVTEFNPASVSFLPGAGTVFNLGVVADISGTPLSADQFRFEFALEGGGTLQGIVEIGRLPTGPVQPGDYNRDGAVDVADYQTWRSSFGQMVLAGTGADGNGDGRIDAADYVVWRHHLSSSLGADSAAMIPEPTSMALFSTLLALRYVGMRANRITSFTKTGNTMSLMYFLRYWYRCPRLQQTFCCMATVFSATIVLADDNRYIVGTAKVDITPDYPIRLNGYGFRRTESEGITQRIWCKALAIGDDEEKPLVLIAVDSLGIRLSMVDEVARRLREKANIERDRLAVTFTHSHTTPKVNGASDTVFSTPIPADHQQRIDRYTEQLTDWLEEAALAALADRRPATLSWGVGTVGFAKNRRTENGPVDHDLPMLVVRSPDGAIRAIYVSYACHCTTLSHNKISGDWAGFAQEIIEYNHPDTVALVSIGCGSDSNPDTRAPGENVVHAAEHGAHIANEVERLLRTTLRPVTGTTSAVLQKIDLPLRDRPTREQLESLAAEDGPAAYNAQHQLATLDRGESLLEAIDYPIQTWAFGDSLAMVFLAGEVCVDYSLRLKAELPADRCWINGYSNDFCSYIPSERLLREGGYGGGAEVVYFALPALLAPGLEEAIVQETLRQLPQFSRQDAAATFTAPSEESIEAVTSGN